MCIVTPNYRSWLYIRITSIYYNAHNFLSAAYGHLLFFFVHAVFWLYVTRANHAAFSLLLFYNIFINSVIYASWQSTLCDKFATVVWL